MFKKLGLIILLCLLNIKIYALENVEYSPYSEFSNWQEENVISSDLIDVETEKRYRWYKTDRVDGDYSIEGNNNPLFPFIDKDNYYETDFSLYSLNEPDSIPNRIIENKKIYSYKQIKPIRYIYLMRVGNLTGSFYISELNVYVDDQKINYSYYCGRCSNNFEYYINNENIYENNVYIYNNMEFRIDLNGYYDASKIRIELYLFDQSIANKNYQLILSPYFNLSAPQYFYKEFSEQFYCNNISEVKHFSYLIDSSWLKEPEWFDWKESEEIVINSFTTEVKQQTLYRYKDIFYRYYQINKIYYDDKYYLDTPAEGYQHDENDYKYYYRYRTREVLKSPELITNNNSSIDNAPVENKKVISESNNHSNISQTVNTISNQNKDISSNNLIETPVISNNKTPIKSNIVATADISSKGSSMVSEDNVVNMIMVKNLGYLLISIGLLIIIAMQYRHKHNL